MSPETQPIPKTDLTLTALIGSSTDLALRAQVEEFVRGISTDIQRVKKVLAPYILTKENYDRLTEKLRQDETPLTPGEKKNIDFTDHQDYLLENTLKAIATLHYLRVTGHQQITVLRQGKPTVINLGEIDIPLFSLAMALNLLKQSLDSHSGSSQRVRVHVIEIY